MYFDVRRIKKGMSEKTSLKNGNTGLELYILMAGSLHCGIGNTACRIDFPEDAVAVGSDDDKKILETEDSVLVFVMAHNFKLRSSFFFNAAPVHTVVFVAAGFHKKADRFFFSVNGQQSKAEKRRFGQIPVVSGNNVRHPLGKLNVFCFHVFFVL